jgi:glycosyltransferase involved in cell wall biosynthesis
MTELKIAIDARLPNATSGGVATVIAGLAAGLSRLSGGEPERYYFLTYADSDEWLQPFVYGPCSVLNVPRAPVSLAKAVRGRVRERVPWLRRVWDALPVLPGTALPSPPRSDGFVERAGMHVIHFAIQNAFLTDLPSIYHPHDLQHVHLPQFFSARARAGRDTYYRAFCNQARTVAVTSRWVRDDLIRHYQLPPAKVAIIPWAPIVAEYPQPSAQDVEDGRKRMALPDDFILYPANTWPHKNHVGLFAALAILRRDRGLRVPLVLSGQQNEYQRELKRYARTMGVEDQIHWVGFVAPLELQVLYHLATAMVIPTRYEAASGPLWEAFASGVPAACSNVTSLPEQANGAALLFDPDDPAAMADAVARLWTDEALRAELIGKGRRNVARFDWDRTARLFRAHYRRVAGADLTGEDRGLLDARPLL